MGTDFVPADYGWLHSPNGTESAWQYFKAGKNCDRQMINDDVVSQLDEAITIIQKHYLNKNHVFVYDNTTTRSKCEDGALSASKITKEPSDKFSVDVNVINKEAKLAYGPDGKLLKQKQRMDNGFFNGQGQSLYFPDDHPTHPRWFKGMAQIFTKCGYNIQGKKAQCRGFFHHDCPKGSINCCC